MKLDETVDNLGQSTQSLLRTMRLDIVLLGSQRDESQASLLKLEKYWEMLQKLIAEQTEKERAEEDEKKNKEKEDENGGNNTPNEQFRRHSSLEWLEHSEKDLQQTNEVEQPTTRTMNLSDYSNRHSSNLDWGEHDDDELEQEDRKADQSAPLTVDNVMNQVESGGDDLPPVKRMFGWGRDNKRDDNQISNKSSAPKESDTRSLSASWFGRTRGKIEQEGDDAVYAVTVGTASSVNSFSWQKLFRRDGSYRSGWGVDEKLSPSIPPASAEKDLSDAISTMQVKLRCCDSAASSLQQLVSYQKRQITDLEHERNRLKLMSEFESLHGQSELKSLRTQVECAQVERTRKIRLLKEAEESRSIVTDKKEKLKEELECVRMELCIRNMQLENSSREENIQVKQDHPKVVLVEQA